jgi:hypothetical protein
MMKTKKIKFQSTNVGVKFLHPQPASRLVPEWFRSLPGVNKGIETVKKCMPFLDSLTTGYMIVLSADVYYDKNGFQEITKDLQISTHDKTQIGTLPLTKEFDTQPYKWHNFFVSKTPKGYSTLFMHPANRVDLPFVSLTGIVETDKFPLAVNFPFLMKKDFSGVIPAGTPIIQAIPIKRENWETEVNDTKPWKQPSFVHTMHNPPFGFYKKHFWERKKYQ